MPKGLSLHIGVNVVDTNHYGNENRLDGPENDARAMQKLAIANGFQTSPDTLLLSADATTDNVTHRLNTLIQQLAPGDILFLSYSGHGGQYWDKSGDEDPIEAASLQHVIPKKTALSEGKKDETLCLYDRMMWDDELYRLLWRVPAGARILYISDCCHATSNFRVLDDDVPPAPAAKGIGIDQSTEIIDLHRSEYNNAWTGVRDFLKTNSKLPASLVQLAACKEEELAGDAVSKDGNGIFTEKLLESWNNGQGGIASYQDWMARIQAKVADAQTQSEPWDFEQTPQIIVDGADTDSFKQQRPFTI